MSYTKKTWKTGDVIDESSMNNIEAGILQSLKGLSANGGTITISKNDGTSTSITINKVANADVATKATQDGNGKVIADTYLAKTNAIATNLVASGSNPQQMLTVARTTSDSSYIMFKGKSGMLGGFGFKAQEGDLYKFNKSVDKSNVLIHDGNIQATLNTLYTGKKEANGYFYTVNGFLVQVGLTSYNGTANPVEVNFPIAFPNKCCALSILGTNSAGEDTRNVTLLYQSSTTTKAIVQVIKNSSAVPTGFSWIAIGY